MVKKKKRSKNSKNKRGAVSTKRIIEFKDDMQEYVVMTKMLGDRRIIVKLPDKSEKLAIIPGRFRRRCWMKAGDILLASYREFQDNKLDIIHKYTPEEARQLVGYKEIPPFFLDSTSGATAAQEAESGVVFECKDDMDFNFDDI